MNGYQMAQKEALEKIQALSTEELQELFLGFDTYSFAPPEALALMEQARSRVPVPWSNKLDGFHILVNYEDVRGAMLDWETFSSSPSNFRPIQEGMPIIPPLMTDPPEHTAWRKIVTNGVNARTAKRITPATRADIVAHIEEFAAKGEAELNAAFCNEIPLLAILNILGIPRERSTEVRELTEKMVGQMDDPMTAVQYAAQFAAMGVEYANDRRTCPKDDYLTELTKSEIAGCPVSDEQIGTSCIGMLSAGSGSTAAELGFLFYEVLSNPELKQRLIDDPSLIPIAVNEIVRLHHPFFGIWRRVTKDVTFAGRDMKEGESVYICWSAANRDPSVFPDPGTLRLDRGTSINHLGFGVGLHQCAGSGTARMEMSVALEEILTRLPDMELVDPLANDFAFMGGERLAVTKLPVRFTPRP